MNVIDIGKQIDEAHRYFQLGLLEQAHAELDVLNEVPEISPLLSGYRMGLLAYQGRWEDAAICAANLCVLEPLEPEHFLAAAEIQRHLGLPGSAIDTLLEGPLALVGYPAYHFQLACYHALLDEFDDARDCLLTALELDGSILDRVSDEPTLEPILASLTLDSDAQSRDPTSTDSDCPF